jgi:hypothetical protein
MLISLVDTYVLSVALTIECRVVDKYKGIIQSLLDTCLYGVCFLYPYLITYRSNISVRLRKVIE